MKMNLLAWGLVCGLSVLVPVATRAQGQPDAKAETKAAPKTEPGKDAAKPTPKAEPGKEAAKPAQNASKPKAEKPPIQLADGAPTMYTVVKGDTLWDIAGRFLKEPWRWPEIWNMNREQIKDPHWIYPGDVIALSFDASGQPMLSVAGGADRFAGTAVGSTVKLSPQVRAEDKAQAVPSIPSKVIGPFLSLPLVVESGGLQNAPRIVATEDGRVIVGSGNVAYAAGLRASQGVKWQIFRPGDALLDPVTQEVLGYEAIYLGDARVTKFGEVSTLEVLKATQEINRGDRLTPTVESTLPSYSPRAPDKQLQGRVVAIRGGLTDAAQYSVVSINAGRKDGIEIGHVLAILQSGETVSTKASGAETLGAGFGLGGLLGSSEKGESAEVPSEVKLPDERNGLLFVFRVFDKVSFGLVMSSRRPIKVGDVVQTP